jgi:hypothetical protein
MRRLLLSLLAVAALATPSAALAHGRWHHHHSLLAKLSGTGTSFAGSSATASGSVAMSDMLGNGTFSATITTDWTKATTRTGDRGTLSCAPSTAALTLTGAISSNTVSGTLTGKTCKWTPTTGSVVSGFFGRGTVTGAGTAAKLTGSTGEAFLVQRSDGTVKGGVFAGFRGERFSSFAAREHDASRLTGDCDHH